MYVVICGPTSNLLYNKLLWYLTLVPYSPTLISGLWWNLNTYYYFVLPKLSRDLHIIFERLWIEHSILYVFITTITNMERVRLLLI